MNAIDRKDLAKRFSAEMQCNCDLDNWQPESSTHHSCVCRIHKAAMSWRPGDTIPTGNAKAGAK